MNNFCQTEWLQQLYKLLENILTDFHIRHLKIINSRIYRSITKQYQIQLNSFSLTTIFPSVWICGCWIQSTGFIEACNCVQKIRIIYIIAVAIAMGTNCRIFLLTEDLEKRIAVQFAWIFEIWQLKCLDIVELLSI